MIHISSAVTGLYYSSAKLWIESCKNLSGCKIHVGTIGFKSKEIDSFYMPYKKPFNCQQQGQVVDFISIKNDTLLMVDVDAFFQRDFNEKERSLIENLSENQIAIGYNWSPDQTASSEYEALKPKSPPDKDMFFKDWESTKIYNFGVVAAKKKVWKRLKKLYESVYPEWSKRFENWRCCQMIACFCVRNLGLEVVLLDRHFHSHHVDENTESYNIKNNKLYYQNMEVLIAHHTPIRPDAI